MRRSKQDSRQINLYHTASPTRLQRPSFYHGGRIEALIEAAECKVIYLLPYSPDLNRIEKCWAWIKSQVRKLLRDSYNLRKAIDSVLKETAS